MGWNKGGVLPSQLIRSMIDSKRICSKLNLYPHVQPASIDLPVGDIAYEMQGVVLPRKGEKVAELIEKYRVPAVPSIDLTKGAILEKGVTYLIRSAVKLKLDSDIKVEASPKSSIGRIDLHTRTVVDSGQLFDTIPVGYEGYIYLYLVSNSFRVYLESGIPVMQLRFRSGDATLDYLETKMLGELHGFVFDKSGSNIPLSITSQLPGALLTLDLQSYETVGWWAKHTHRPIFMNRLDNPITEFWQAIPRPKNGALHVPHGQFGIYVTKEFVAFPPFVKSRDKNSNGIEPGFSGVMMIYDPTAGEFRAHYAGFFDPGFGCRFSKTNGDKNSSGFLNWKKKVKRRGNAGVLEIRSFEKDRILRDGDPICRMIYERLLEIPDIIYGTDGLGSNYGIQQGAKLSKFFK
jgi:dCTP deaminase